MKNIQQKQLLINETFIIDHSIHTEWIEYFKENFIAYLKKKPNIKDLVLSKIQGEYNPDGENYALQYRTGEKGKKAIENDEYLQSIRYKLSEKYKNQYASFVTILEIIEI